MRVQCDTRLFDTHDDEDLITMGSSVRRIIDVVTELVYRTGRVGHNNTQHEPKTKPADSPYGSVSKVYPSLKPSVSPEERAQKAADARRGANRLKGVGHPTTSDPDYSTKEVEFMLAMDEYKRRTGRQFPTWQEVLRVITSLGYNKS
jgi:hypothetical protein